MLETDRMVLRRVETRDLEDLVALNADTEVMRYLGDSHPMQRERVLAEELPRLMADNNRTDLLGFWAGHDRTTGLFVGWFGVSSETFPAETAQLGYRLHRDSWGRGYATEGAVRMVELARAAGATTVTATTMAVNVASRRVMEKAGLRLVRTWFGEWVDPIPGAELGDVDYELAIAARDRPYGPG